jgi:hypothetical protein
MTKEPIHLYHYHHLYSKDQNHPRTITRTKMDQSLHTGVTIFHHHIYTILDYKEENKSTPIEGNILTLPKKFDTTPLQQDYSVNKALDDVYPKKGVESKIEYKITKPLPFDKWKLPPIKIPPLLKPEELLSRRATYIANKVSRQAREHAQKVLEEIELIVPNKPSIIEDKGGGIIGKGVRVSNGKSEGIVLSSYKRKGRQLRWRVELDSGERVLYYRKDLRVI